MGALSNIGPTAVAVWASAVVLFALIAVLRAVFKLNFSLLTVLALGLGIALSLVFDGQVDSLNLLGNIYINLITALVAPLIFVSIISSITYVGSLKKLRSIGLRSVGWLLLTNLIAIVMTLGVAIPLHIGSGVKLVDDESTAGFLTSQTAPLDQVILNFFPKNIVGDLSGNRVVPIIITATVLAIAIVSVGRQKDVSIVKRFFEQTKDVIYKAVGYVAELTPYAVVVLGATSTAATTSKADALLALLSILVLGFVLNIIQAFVVNGLLLKFVAHVSPLTFFKAVLPAQTTAFATQSSVATLPLSIRQLGTVGVGADVANFTTPIGTTIGMPGCAGVWPMLSAVFTINALGLGYSPVSYVALAVIGLLSSIGTAGVPGTMANVSAAVTCAAIVSRQTGEFDESVLDSARAGRHRHRAGVVVSPAGGAVAAPVVPVAAPLGAVGVAASVVASPVAAGVGAAHKPVQPGFAVTPGLSLTLHQSTLRVQADDDADDAPVPVGACGISAHAATAKAA